MLQKWGHYECYFAEGATWPGFDEWIMILNPNNEPSELIIRFFTPDSYEKEVLTTVEANSRNTLHINDYLPNRDVSVVVTVTNYVPVYAERSMYFDAPGKWGSHCSFGNKDRYHGSRFPEGCTLPGYDMWIMILPVGNDVTANITFYTHGGNAVEGPEITLKAWQRGTIHVNDYIQNEEFSTVVESNGKVAVERSVYVTEPGKYGSYNSLGTLPSIYSYFAEGCTREGFEEWLIVFNPEEYAVTTWMEFYTPQGKVLDREYKIRSHDRLKLRVNDIVPNNDVSIRVWSTDTALGAWVVPERLMFISGGRVSLDRL